MNKKIIVISIVSASLVIGAALFSFVRSQSESITTPSISQSQQNDPAPQAPNEQTESTKQLVPQDPGFNKNQHSLASPDSIWVVVNRQRPLTPEDYVPADLTVPDVALRLSPNAEQSQISQKAVQYVKNLFTAAEAAGHQLQFGSGYRGYDYQKQLYDGYVANMGQTEADKISARPGTSEHQTGLAFDVTLPNGECFLETCLGDLPEGIWIANNAYKYGWIIRYPENKQDETGYTYEPWHLRYVGVELATEMHTQNIQTLEEFFNL